jgi:hypothetical protein
MYVDYRPAKEKIKVYSKVGLKIALMIVLLSAATAEPAAAAFKLGNIYDIVPAIPNVIN